MTIRVLFLTAVTAAMVAFASPASEKRKITVTGTSRTRRVVTLNIALGGRPGEMYCFLTARDCAVPQPGEYVIQPAKNPIYQDCPNVDLFPPAADPYKDKPIGIYCLLSPEG
jgi:hypothetical protein